MVAYSKDPRPIDTWELMRKEAQISSIRVHTQPAYAAALRMILTDDALRRSLLSLITCEYPLSDVQTAFTDSMKGGAVCKVMVRIS